MLLKGLTLYAPNLYNKYSNIGFSLAGLVLEAVGKTDYETLVNNQAHITLAFAAAAAIVRANSHTGADVFRNIGTSQ